MREDLVMKVEGCNSNCHPKMELVEISTMGLVTLKFDRDMKVPSTDELQLWAGNNSYPLQDFNRTNNFTAFQVGVKNGSADGNISMTWRVTTFEARKLQI